MCSGICSGWSAVERHRAHGRPQRWPAAEAVSGGSSCSGSRNATAGKRCASTRAGQQAAPRCAAGGLALLTGRMGPMRAGRRSPVHLKSGMLRERPCVAEWQAAQQQVQFGSSEQAGIWAPAAHTEACLQNTAAAGPAIHPLDYVQSSKQPQLRLCCLTWPRRVQ